MTTPASPRTLRAILADEFALKEEAQRLFTKYDADHSGFIIAPELKSMLCDLSEQLEIPKPSDEEAAGVLDSFDANHDAKLSLDEFTGVVRTLLTLRVEAEANAAEAAADAAKA